jgi:hypothetical protein
VTVPAAERSFPRTDCPWRRSRRRRGDGPRRQRGHLRRRCRKLCRDRRRTRGARRAGRRRQRRQRRRRLNLTLPGEVSTPVRGKSPVKLTIEGLPYDTKVRKIRTLLGWASFRLSPGDEDWPQYRKVVLIRSTGSPRRRPTRRARSTSATRTRSSATACTSSALARRRRTPSRARF